MAWRKIERKRREHEAEEAIRKVGGQVFFDYQRGGWFSGGPTLRTDTEPFGPAWLRKLFGEDFFSEVDGVYFSETNVTDAGLANLKPLSTLQWLTLDSNQVSDAGLANLTGLTELRWLYVSGRQFTDSGLKHLNGLSQLKKLVLDQTMISDAGADALLKRLPDGFEIVRSLASGSGGRR